MIDERLFSNPTNWACSCQEVEAHKGEKQEKNNKTAASVVSKTPIDTHLCFKWH